MGHLRGSNHPFPFALCTLFLVNAPPVGVVEGWHQMLNLGELLTS